MYIIKSMVMSIPSTNVDVSTITTKIDDITTILPRRTCIVQRVSEIDENETPPIVWDFTKNWKPVNYDEEDEENDKLFWGDCVFTKEELNSPKFEGWSTYDKKSYLHKLYLKKKGYENLTKSEKSMIQCTGYNCRCGGIDRYGYCITYNSLEWNECFKQEQRNKEIWELFPLTGVRERARTIFEKGDEIYPFFVPCDRSKPIRRLKVSKKKFKYFKYKPNRRNVTY